mgnify:CR=1 FL=1
MEYKYFNNGEVLHLDFELDSRYDVGTTYEDYLDGAWVPLSKEQEEFYNATLPHPSVRYSNVSWSLPMSLLWKT